jgi:hypothetical protein
VRAIQLEPWCLRGRSAMCLGHELQRLHRDGTNRLRAECMERRHMLCVVRRWHDESDTNHYHPIGVWRRIMWTIHSACLV